jgi:predicted RNA binding protein YcfA (HicA-like mRNA interferase family)
MGESLPALNGEELIEYLNFDGWVDCGKCTHGITLKKYVNKECLITTIPIKKKRMPTGTLGDILSVKQTRLGRNGLLGIIKKFNKQKANS